MGRENPEVAVWPKSPFFWMALKIQSFLDVVFLLHFDGDFEGGLEYDTNVSLDMTANGGLAMTGNVTSI